MPQAMMLLILTIYAAMDTASCATQTPLQVTTTPFTTIGRTRSLQRSAVERLSFGAKLLGDVGAAVSAGTTLRDTCRAR